MSRLLVLIAVLVIVGCEQTKTPSDDVIGKVVVKQAGQVHTEWTATNRFTVTYQQTFNAGYGENRRDILVITDLQTGAEYLGITGCGVTELRRKTDGKTTVTVEE
jgi:hypothetical protein